MGVKLKEPNKKIYPFYKKWWFWLIVISLLIVMYSYSRQSYKNNSNATFSTMTTEATKVTTFPEETEKEFKNSCETIAYKKLARNPDKYKGNKYKFTGEVIQVQEPTIGQTVELRINVTKDEFDFWDDTIYATVEIPEGEDRILEDDILTFWGTCDGLYSYTSITNSKISLPKISIKYFMIDNE